MFSGVYRYIAAYTGRYRPSKRSTVGRVGTEWDVSATPFRRRRFGDGQFGDQTIRRQDSSAMGQFGDHFI